MYTYILGDGIHKPAYVSRTGGYFRQLPKIKDKPSIEVGTVEETQSPVDGKHGIWFAHKVESTNADNEVSNSETHYYRQELLPPGVTYDDVVEDGECGSSVKIKHPGGASPIEEYVSATVHSIPSDLLHAHPLESFNRPISFYNNKFKEGIIRADYDSNHSVRGFIHEFLGEQPGELRNVYFNKILLSGDDDLGIDKPEQWIENNNGKLVSLKIASDAILLDEAPEICGYLERGNNQRGIIYHDPRGGVTQINERCLIIPNTNEVGKKDEELERMISEREGVILESAGRNMYNVIRIGEVRHAHSKGRDSFSELGW